MNMMVSVITQCGNIVHFPGAVGAGVVLGLILCFLSSTQQTLLARGGGNLKARHKSYWS